MSRSSGGLKTLSIKIGYSEPSRDEGGEGSSTVAEGSQVLSGDVILDSNWLTNLGFSCSIVIGC